VLCPLQSPAFFQPDGCCLRNISSKSPSASSRE
jgi:hypothetical protein